MRYNPYSAHAARSARERIEYYRKRYPELKERELADRLINDKARLCAFAGAFTAVPAVVPGMGTVIAIFSGILVDITVLGILLSRLVLELSTLYGHDPLSGRVQQEALHVFGLAAGVQSVGKRAAKTLSNTLTRQAAAGGMSRPLMLMGLKASQRSAVVRILPLAGIGLAGLISYFFARGIGRRMLTHYEKPGEMDWPGRTLEAEYRIIDDGLQRDSGTAI
ncbi:MAG: hypothetical protein RDV00_06645 [Clostridia bacterium]|nr:hypothetical protein [Clostridia bacterium]MDQ7791779.1 hypothetical protein [Clostridia bacterium]